MRRTVLCFALVTCAVAFGASSAAAAPADLDRSFGGDGIVRVEAPFGLGFPSDAAARMAIGPRDEVFVLYSNYTSCELFSTCQIALSVLRYDRNGRRDPSFGIGPGSQLTVTQSPGFGSSFDLAVGPDGKPVVAAGDGGDRIVVARFDQAGRLDGSFGSGGVASSIELTPFEPPVLAVQPDGKVVVAVESTFEGARERLQLGRYLPDGTPDPGFGLDGEAAMALPTRTRPVKVMLGPGGSMTVATPQCCGGSAHFGDGFSVARFLADGSPDPGLDGDGQLHFQTPGMEATVEAAALAADGSVFIAFEEGTELRFRTGNVVKLTPAGALDPTFGGDGRIWLYSRGLDFSRSGDLVVDAQDRLVGLGSDGDVAFYRLRADGVTDRTFNGGQSISFKIGKALESGVDVGLQSDGRIVALGESDGNRKLFGLIRLRGGTDRTRCLGKKATIVGTRGPDELAGTPRRDVIAALGGKDVVRALSGSDLICGGKGRDQLFGGPGRDLTDEDPRPRKSKRR